MITRTPFKTCLDFQGICVYINWVLPENCSSGFFPVSLLMLWAWLFVSQWRTKSQLNCNNGSWSLNLWGTKMVMNIFPFWVRVPSYSRFCSPLSTPNWQNSLHLAKIIQVSDRRCSKALFFDKNPNWNSSFQGWKFAGFIVLNCLGRD